MKDTNPTIWIAERLDNKSQKWLPVPTIQPRMKRAQVLTQMRVYLRDVGYGMKLPPHYRIIEYIRLEERKVK